MTREEIARVIAPDAWRKVDWLRRNADTSDQTSEKVRGIWRNEATDLAKSSLAKADAILAKLHQDAGNGEQGPREKASRQDRLIDSAYAAGLKAGWNLCVSDDGEELNRCVEQRIVGHREAIEKARAADALERGSQVGDGWVRVPREPTAEMLDAVCDRRNPAGRACYRGDWHAMIAAAPAHGGGDA